MWWSRFVNRMDAFAWQDADDKSCWYSARYQQLTPRHFEAHLAGVVTMGLPALDQDGLSRWCCFDSDKDDGSLDKIEQFLIKYHWHYVREGQRPGRQGHLWIFFDQPIPAADLRLLGYRILELVGIAPESIEFFPKQDKPTYDVKEQRFRASSIVRLPLGIHRKPSANGARGWFRDAEQDLQQQIKYIHTQPLNPVAPVQEQVLKLRQLASATKAIRRPVAKQSGIFKQHDVEIALTRISADVPYPFWLKIGMALHHSGFSLEMWEQWSARGSKYKPGECAQKWESFNTEDNRECVGLGTIFHYANESEKLGTILYIYSAKKTGDS